MRGRRSEFLATIGRARAGVSAHDVDADLRRVGTQLQSAFPETNGGLTFTSTPLREMIVGDVQRPLLVLLGAVGFVLLVACANVANLLLARGSARHGELAVRAAIGAGRARLVRQLITEAIVLGLVGGVLGLMIAYAGTAALIAAKPADLPRLDQIGLDGTVALFTLGAALLTGLVFGMVPALQATNDHLLRGLQESGRVRGRRPARASPAIGAGRGGDGARGDPADGIGPVDSQLRGADARESRLSAGGRDGDPGHVPGRDVQGRRSNQESRQRHRRSLARLARRDRSGRRHGATARRSRRVERLCRRGRASAASGRESGNRGRQRDARLFPRHRYAAAAGPPVHRARS